VQGRNQNVPGKSIKSATVRPVTDFTWAKVCVYSYSKFVFEFETLFWSFDIECFPNSPTVAESGFGQPCWLVLRKCKLVFACFWAQ
jgi:hypothetical protein